MKRPREEEEGDESFSDESFSDEGVDDGEDEVIAVEDTSGGAGAGPRNASPSAHVSPYVQRYLELKATIGISWHTNSNKWQCNRHLGGKICIPSPTTYGDEAKAAEAIDRKVIEVFGPDRARKLGLNLDLGVYESEAVRGLLVGTDAALAFSKCRRPKRGNPRVPSGVVVERRGPISDHELQGEGVAEDEEAGGEEEEDAPMPEVYTCESPHVAALLARNIRSVGVTYVKRKGLTKPFEAKRNINGTRVLAEPHYCATRAEAVLAVDRVTLKHLDPQAARDIGLNYDLGAHRDPDIARQLEGTNAATAFSLFNKKKRWGKADGAGAQPSPAPAKQTGGGSEPQTHIVPPRPVEPQPSRAPTATATRAEVTTQPQPILLIPPFPPPAGLNLDDPQTASPDLPRLTRWISDLLHWLASFEPSPGSASADHHERLTTLLSATKRRLLLASLESDGGAGAARSAGQLTTYQLQQRVRLFVQEGGWWCEGYVGGRLPGVHVLLQKLLDEAGVLEAS